MRQRRARTRLDETGLDVLRCGLDMFRDFRGPDGEAALRILWRTRGNDLLAECVRKDGTVRPAGWWWWSAPMSLRLPYPTVLFPTEMRVRLLEAGLLKGDVAEVAKQKIRAFRESGKPVAFYDTSE